MIAADAAAFAAAQFMPVDQAYLLEARQMQALSFAVHRGSGLSLFGGSSWARAFGVVALFTFIGFAFVAIATPIQHR